MSSFYSKQVKAVQAAKASGNTFDINDVIDSDPRKISWSRALKKAAEDGKLPSEDIVASIVAAYRPFQRMWLYHDAFFIESIGRQRHFVGPGANIVITIPGKGSSNGFQPIVIDVCADYNSQSAGAQCFPLYLYDKVEEEGKLNLGGEDGETIDGYRRRDAITDGMLKTFRETYEKKLTKEDIFYYVYGILHSPEYRERFAADLKKMLPRIPLTQDSADFWAFSQAGRDLAELHLHYETVEPWPEVVEHDGGPMTMAMSDKFKVKKMTFGRPTAAQKADGLKHDKTKIVYNAHISLTNIPLEAYDYVVNGKPALEWVMDRYQVTVDKKSGIKNDPNDWCTEHDNPRYIVDLLLRLVRVSLETNQIVANLPALNEQTT